jgi:hypothetical protein
METGALASSITVRTNERRRSALASAREVDTTPYRSETPMYQIGPRGS